MSADHALSIPKAALRPVRSIVRSAIIVIAYVLGFFGVLPITLVRFGLRVDAALGLPEVSGAVGRWLGAPLSLLGWVLLSRAMLELSQRGRGLPISHLPPRRLVVSGWFARLRHPIYVGYSLSLLGAGLALRSVGVALVATPLLVGAWCAYAAFIEEPVLVRRFGASYEAHLARTQRLPHPGELEGLAALLWRLLRPAAEFVAARPVLFRLGPGVWVGYGAFVALGAASAAALAVVFFAKALPSLLVYEYVLGLALCMLVGGRLAWLGYERRALFTAPKETLRRVGFVSFGAYAAMLVFASAWPKLRASELGSLWFLDRTMLACLVCSGFGRLGCLSYGCCYGKPWSHGMRCTHPKSKVRRERGPDGALPRAPTQVLSALLAFGSAALLAALLVQGAPRGFSAAFTAVVYGLSRFGLEGLRDEPRFFDGRLTRGQILAALIGVSALALLAFAPFGSRTGLEFVTSLDPSALRAFPWLPALAALPVFTVCGYHRRDVGRW
ncbi:MAG TPA: prolipoprotein diacylglyceryl transferase family protein [Polyangiaceae bacterium]|nr:prolipoprotein diacylglyceryl transferase family protein [Polyangiaceae bacterium]